MATYSLGGMLAGKAGTGGKASRGGMRMLVDDEIPAHDKRAAKRELNQLYADQFAATHVANNPHATQTSVREAWKVAGHGSQRVDWLLASFDKAMKAKGLAKRGRGRPPGNSQTK